jgi:hypothetical protein
VFVRKGKAMSREDEKNGRETERHPDNFITTRWHRKGCPSEGTPGDKYMAANATTGGECGDLFTKCSRCGQSGKHHFSLTENPDYRALKARLEELGVKGFPETRKSK